MPNRKNIRLLVAAVVVAMPIAALAQAKPIATSPARQPATAPSATSLPAVTITLDPALSELVNKLPGEGGPGGRPILDSIYALGPAKLAELVKAVQAPGYAEDQKVRLALHGLAVHLGGDPGRRKVLADALTLRLQGDENPHVKGFFIEQLELANASEASTAVAAVLLEKDVTAYAVRALVSFKRGQAELLAALPKLTGKDRLQVISALGSLAYDKSIPALRPLAQDADRDTRITAMTALAQLGDAGSVDVMLRASEAENPFERGRGVDACVRLATQLVPSNPVAAEKIYRSLWARSGKDNRAAKIAGFQGIVALQGEKAMPELLEAVSSDDAQLRAVAVRLGGALPGEKVTRFWIGQLEKSKNQADILSLLEGRGDASAFSAVSGLLTATEPTTLIAAIRASAALGQERAVPLLVPFLIHTSADVKAAAARALTAIPSRQANPLLAGYLTPGEPSSTKVAVLSLLAARGAKDQQGGIVAMVKDKDELVRIAAYNALEPLADESLAPVLVGGALKGSDSEKPAAERALVATLRRVQDEDARAKPVLDALASADETTKPVLTRILGQIGGKRAVATLLAMVKDANAETQDIAIRSLARSTDPVTMPTLLELARTAPKQAHQVLAMQGYLRLLGAQPFEEPEEKVKKYAEGFALAGRVEEKRTVLAGLGGIAAVKSLEAIMSHLDDAGLHNEAAVAAVKVCEKLIWNEPAKCQAALEKILASTKDAGVRKQADAVLAQLRKKR